MPRLDNETILLAFVAVTGLAVLMQAIILLVIFITMRKAAESIRKELEGLRTSLMPVLSETLDVLTSTHKFFGRMAPKIEAVSDDLEAMAHGLRAQSVQFQSSLEEILERARIQGKRLDGMVSHLLDTLEYAEDFMTVMVCKPVRQISGIVRAAKAVVESLRSTRRRPA
jgi:hypothetical protein